MKSFMRSLKVYLIRGFTVVFGFILITNFYLGSKIAFAGNIVPGSFAYGENVGWVNLIPANGAEVTVSDSAVTGYAWGENIGWINLGPFTGSVANDGSGHLSGFAWAENVGWINFAPIGGGVTINGDTGKFAGYAWGENVGWIDFAPAGSGITTSWRPNTPTGSNIPVTPQDTATGIAPATITLSTVTQAGTTTLTTSGSGAPPPLGFALGNPPMFYDIKTTAVYSGPVTVCINYRGVSFTDVSTLRLFHNEGGAWVDRTASLDTAGKVICGSVSSFSPFGVFQSAYRFKGFFPPVDNLPVINKVKAGSAVPVKFTLGGNQGLKIMASGYPASAITPCDSSAPVDAIDMTVTAGSSSLSYDAFTDQYIYIWKTDKMWAGSCRQLVLKLNDSAYHRVNFSFTR